MNDNRSSAGIERAAPGERPKRPRLRFGLLSFLMFVCLTGATLGIVGNQVSRNLSLKQAHDSDLAGLQGTWKLGGALTMVIKGNTIIFTSWGDSFAGYETFTIDVAASPRTIDVVRYNGIGHAVRSVYAYRLRKDTLELRLVSKTSKDGSLVAPEAPDPVLTFNRASGSPDE